MISSQDRVALFHSTYRVLAAEKALKEKAADFLLIPAPRELSSACGLAIRYAKAEHAWIEEILTEAGLLPAELFVREASGYRKLL